jgi:hypothetical protein
MLYVNRRDAVCLNATEPSLRFTDNLRHFLTNQNAYR